MLDAVFITLARLQNDARALNIARVVAQNRSVAIIGRAAPKDAPTAALINDGIQRFPIDLPEQRLLRILPSFTIQVLRLLQYHRPPIIYAADVYSLAIAALYSRTNSVTIIYDARELYFALGALGKRKIVQYIVSKTEHIAIRSADVVLTSGTIDSEHLQQRYPAIPTPIVIYNFPPFRPKVQSDLLREQFAIPANAPIAVYQGMIFAGRGIKPALHALVHAPEFHLCLLGEGEFLPEVRRLAQELHIADRVHCTGLLPYDELHTWTCSATVGLSFIEPISLSYQLALPNKMFEYCMAGIPTLASDLPAQRQFIEQYNIGTLVSPSASPTEIASALRSLVARKESFAEICNQAAQKLCFDAQQEPLQNVFRCSL